MSKNVEKQEQRETVYGLIAANKNEEIKICSNCMNEGQEVKSCYDQPEERFCITRATEEKKVNTNQVDNLGLILSNVTNRPGNPQGKEKWIGDSCATVDLC